MTDSMPWMTQFDGDGLESKTGVSALLATSDAEGWPHVAYLSCGEILAMPPDRVRLCLWRRSGTAHNIGLARRACLHVAADGIVWEARLSSIDEVDTDMLLLVEMEVVKTIRHQAPYARVEAMIGFSLAEPARTVERWREQLARLRAFKSPAR